MLRKLISNKRMYAMIVMLATLTLAFTVYASTGFKQVKLLIGSQPVIYAYTSQNTVNDLLVEFEMDHTEDVLLSSVKEDSSETNNENEIETSKRITVIDAGNQYEIYSTLSTVGDLIDHGIITLDVENDYMNVTARNELFDSMTITITRVTHETLTEEYEIPFKTKKVESTSVKKGEEVVVTEGVNGIGEKTIVVTYENGVEKCREVTNSRVARRSVTEVIEVGVEPQSKKAGNLNLGGSEKPTSYKNVITASATAYCACARCCGVSTGITASGMKAVYGCVAVDPRVIPLGTKLYIECPDGSYVYGHSIAADTGGAIKGNKVDLFFPSHSDALQFGRRTVNVYILD